MAAFWPRANPQNGLYLTLTPHVFLLTFPYSCISTVWSREFTMSSRGTPPATATGPSPIGRPTSTPRLPSTTIGQTAFLSNGPSGKHIFVFIMCLSPGVGVQGNDLLEPLKTIHPPLCVGVCVCLSLFVCVGHWVIPNRQTDFHPRIYPRLQGPTASLSSGLSRNNRSSFLAMCVQASVCGAAS